MTTVSLPLITVCIPAYGRAAVLPELLDSILSQDYDDFDVLLCEDASPERAAIAAIVADYQARYPGRVHYHANEKNLGYDGNIRNLVAQAGGRYCFFMGNDDLMQAGALKTVAAALGRYPEVGVILRSYASFDGTPDNINQVYRYFEEERLFPPGPQTIATFYRRCVVIPGLVLNRAAALKHATERFDGTLLYQLYLVATLLVDMNGVSLPEVLALYRNGGIPDFGNSEKEKGKFVPTLQTPESSLHFMRGMLQIASWVEAERKVPIYQAILRDIGNYSYPIISIQSGRSLPVFVGYAFRLALLGFWKCGMFYLYFLSIVFLGAQRVDGLIRFIKRRLGHTPRIGSVYRGAAK
jgi:abequosyltransferase